MAQSEPQYINSISRAIRILELFGRTDTQYLGISEISQELGLSKTTVFNIVKTLLHEKWLLQDTPNGKYRLGPRILKVTTTAAQSISVEDLILEEMHRLRNLFNEDVILTSMVDGIPICVEKVQSSNYLRIQSRVGRVSSLIRGSTGKALLAWQTEDFIASTLKQSFPDTPQGQQERDRLQAELKQIHSQGYCATVSEQNKGVASVTVPIRNRDGIAKYSLCVIGEEKRIFEKGIDNIKAEVLKTTRRLEDELLPML